MNGLLRRRAGVWVLAALAALLTWPRAALAEHEEIALLFLGNSHTQLHQIPELVGAMFRQTHPARHVVVASAPGLLFLDERRRDADTRALFNSRRWTHVVLQAQRYSASGHTRHSTRDARAWVDRVHQQGGRPLLFPEWPRRGVDESQRIHALYAGIGSAAGACVAPVPQAFDFALARHPALPLHDRDGNHSSPAGALLAAYLLFAAASGISPDRLDHLPLSPLDAPAQAFLRELATASLAAGPGMPAPCPGS